MRKNRVSGLAIILLFSILVLTCSGCKKAAQAPQKTGTPEVAVVTLREESITLTSELPGRTSPYLVAEVRPQVNGIIQRRSFVEGGDVKAGDVLYEIDPAPYQAALSNARATLVRAEANLPSIRSRAERYKELVAINAVSQQDYDDAVSAVKQAEAAIEAARAGVEAARINLAYTRITAPISGRTGRSNVTVGALATAHQAVPFTTIQQLDPIYVDATQSSASLLQLERNLEAGRITGGPGRARVKLLLEDGTPYPLEGTMEFSDVTVSQGTGSVILRMVFPNPKHILLPGMYVKPIIQEGVVRQAILAPQSAVSRNPKGDPLALVVNASDKVEQRALKIGRAMGNRWLVTEGLTAGDRLIVEGLQKIRPGVSVRVVPAEAAQAMPAGEQVTKPAAKAE